GDTGLLLSPQPARILATPYWAVHHFGIERRRFGVIQSAAAQARRLEAMTGIEPTQARRLLTTLPGIGPWSAAEVSVVALGDRDVVSLGDYHLPHQVSWALAGEARASEARMPAHLEQVDEATMRGDRGIDLPVEHLLDARGDRVAPALIRVVDAQRPAER